MGGLTSPFGALMAFGAGRETAFVVQAIATLLAACAVALVWRPGARAPLPLRAAVLLAATPVAVPVLMFYDLMLVFVALVWLSRVPPAGMRRGGRWRWRRCFLARCCREICRPKPTGWWRSSPRRSRSV